MVAGVATEKGWQVFCNEVAYHAGKTKSESYFDFTTAIGSLRWFKGTTAFAELVGEAYAHANDVEHWRDLTTRRTIEPIILDWKKHERDDKSFYLELVGVKHTSNVDLILSGETP